MHSSRAHPRAQGLELRMLWKERNVGEYFIRPGGPAAFTVGSASGVDFAMDDGRLGGPRFEVVRRSARGFELRFTAKMPGAITRQGRQLALSEAVAQGLAQPDGEALAVTLFSGDLARVELGGVTLKASFQPVPHPVFAALADRLDYPALNILLAVFFIVGGFVISAENYAGDTQADADELAATPAQVRNIEARLAVAPPNRLVERLRAKRTADAPSAAQQRPEGQAGDRRAAAPHRRASPSATRSGSDRSRQLLRNLFGGLSTAGALAEGPGLSGELTQALGRVSGEFFGSARFAKAVSQAAVSTASWSAKSSRLIAGRFATATKSSSPAAHRWPARLRSVS